MGMGSGTCPKCGVKFNARWSSIGTVRRCQACGHKFILQAAPFGCGGCISTVIGIGAIGVCLIVCCGGLSFLGTFGRNENANSQAVAPEPFVAPQPDELAAVPVQPQQSPVVIPETKPEPKPTDEELYQVIDETYGFPIADLDARTFIKDLRALGFAGPEAKVHHDGLPGAPEAKLLLSYYLDRKIEKVEFSVDVITDHRYQVRNIQYMLTSLDGKPVTNKASELLGPSISLLKRPKVTKWFIDNSGKKISDDFEGILLESVGGSPQLWMYNLKGSRSTATVGPPSQSVVSNDYHAPREWSDVTGTFKVNASFVSFGNGIVKLRKQDGKVIDVPIEKLSPNDEAFVRKLLRQ